MFVFSDLKNLYDYVNKELKKLRDDVARPFGDADGPYTSTCVARYGRITLVDSSNGNINVRLPKIEPGLINRTVIVKKVSDDSNTIAIYPHIDDTIDGSTSLSFTEARGSALIIATSGKWNEL